MAPDAMLGYHGVTLSSHLFVDASLFRNKPSVSGAGRVFIPRLIKDGKGKRRMRLK